MERTKSALGITYTLIPTPNRKVVLDFGLEYSTGGGAFSTIIIDKKGRIRYKNIDIWSLTSASTIIKGGMIWHQKLSKKSLKHFQNWL